LVLSLWKVEDGAATALMSAFYRALATGLSKAAALRQAQLALLGGDASGGAYQAPFYWAPFQLLGHGGPL
jgi:CHAT domain-containing protein